ncbi:MAG: tripartite tricarboxylate transporter TctB family protein [Deltaproteobacteria bacterium]|nr:tripartite tricarboxylate transporter TctB family protein [Deltaproteobacteria bacterium]
MSKRLSKLMIIGAHFLLAVLLFLSTARYPECVQSSTATYVRFIGLTLAILSVIQFLLWLKDPDRSLREKLGIIVNARGFWGLLILLLCYAAALGMLGFYISSALFLPVTMYLLGARNIAAIGGTSVSVLLFVYLVFGKILGVLMPEALLFN